VRAVSDQGIRLATRRDALATDLARTEEEIEALSRRVTCLLKVTELFQALMNRLVTDQVKTIERIVTDGLHTIFFDQELTFEAEIGTRYNKVAIDFLMRQGEGALAIRDKPLEGFGGGPVSVASLLLRVLTMLRLGRKPILFLDETLSAVSDEYVDTTGRFLKRLAASAGIDILLVTHKQAYLDNADAAYRGQEVCVEDGSKHLGLKQLRGSTCGP
jgi:ABC-type branched-subunit amino acid transport system ATPase component